MVFPVQVLALLDRTQNRKLLSIEIFPFRPISVKISGSMDVEIIATTFLSVFPRMPTGIVGAQLAIFWK
jgi:hypothetical protein